MTSLIFLSAFLWLIFLDILLSIVLILNLFESRPTRRRYLTDILRKTQQRRSLLHSILFGAVEPIQIINHYLT